MTGIFKTIPPIAWPSLLAGHTTSLLVISLCLISGILCGCSKNNSRDTLNTYFGSDIPSSASDIHYIADKTPEFYMVSLYVKFKVPLEDAIEFAQTLGLRKDKTTITPSKQIDWWQLPDIFEQQNLEHRYTKTSPEVVTDTLNGRINLIWHEGYAYLFKFGEL